MAGTNEESMEDQAIGIYKEGLWAEEHGQNDIAQDKLREALALDRGKHQEIIDALERVEKNTKRK